MSFLPWIFAKNFMLKMIRTTVRVVTWCLGDFLLKYPELGSLTDDNIDFAQKPNQMTSVNFRLSNITQRKLEEFPEINQFYWKNYSYVVFTYCTHRLFSHHKIYLCNSILNHFNPVDGYEIVFLLQKNEIINFNGFVKNSYPKKL